MAAPFYVLYAQEKAGIPASMVGRLLNAQIIGGIVIAAIAGWANDRFGPRNAIFVSAIFGLCSPVLALLAGTGVTWPFWAVFCCLGGVFATWPIGITTYLYKMVSPQEQKSYLGILNTAIGPTALFPILGGLIAQVASYQSVFIITGIFMVFAILVTVRLGGAEQTA